MQEKKLLVILGLPRYIVHAIVAWMVNATRKISQDQCDQMLE